jgi:hypothetical protein
MNLTSRLVLPAAAISAVALAACGSNGPTTTTSANNGSGAQGNGVNAAYRFSACMRAHGVSKFPDPVVHKSAGSESVGIRVTPGETSSPTFESAQKACNGILPQANNSNNGPSPAQQQQRTQEFVAFAQCLRSHGYTKFPDPDAQGELQPQTIAASGINVHAPGFFTTAKGCLPALKGTVTVAQLQQAINKLPAPGASTTGG